MAINASRAPASIPWTRADIATRLDTPRMIPNIVSSERNLCAQISFNPITIALHRFMLNPGGRGPAEESGARFFHCLGTRP